MVGKKPLVRPRQVNTGLKQRKLSIENVCYSSVQNIFLIFAIWKSERYNTYNCLYGYEN